MKTYGVVGVADVTVTVLDAARRSVRSIVTGHTRLIGSAKRVGRSRDNDRSRAWALCRCTQNDVWCPSTIRVHDLTCTHSKRIIPARAWEEMLMSERSLALA